MAKGAGLSFRLKGLLWQAVGLWPTAAKRRLWLPPNANSKNGFSEHYLSISSILRNEETYLTEWIEFHQMMGVDHFYLYDNGSTDGSLSLLRSYERQGIATIIPWTNFLGGWEGVSGPYGRMQRLAMLHCISNFGSQSKWMAFIDIDEFLYPVTKSSLGSLLETYEDIPSLSVYWNMFGTSGHTHKPKGLVTENFTQRLQRPHGKNKSTGRAKSIVQPSAVLGVHNSHTLILHQGYPLSWNEKRERIGHVDYNPSTFSNDIIRINHYYSKSRAEYRARQKVPAEGPRKDFRGNDNLLNLIETDSVTDVAIQRFVPELRKRVSNRQLADFFPMGRKGVKTEGRNSI